MKMVLLSTQTYVLAEKLELNHASRSTRNKLVTQKLLKQGYRYHKLCKTFFKFYRGYYNLISM